MYMLTSTIWSPIGTDIFRRSPSSGMFTEKSSPGGCKTLQFLRVVERAQSRFPSENDGGGAAGAAFNRAAINVRLVNSGMGPLRFGFASATVSFAGGFLRIASALTNSHGAT